MKASGEFDYQLINEKKVMRNNFMVGHNRLATSGECFTYPEEVIDMNYMDMNPWGINPFTRIANWWKSLDGAISKNYNNHPFKIGDLLLVHNGIIWNYNKLKKKYKIDTEIETDSYVIIYLIHHFLNKSKQEERLDKIVAHLKIENDKATSRSELYHQAMSKWLAG